MTIKEKLQPIWSKMRSKWNFDAEDLLVRVIGIDYYDDLLDHWESLGHRTQKFMKVMGILTPIIILIAVISLSIVRLYTPKESLSQGFTPTVLHWENQIIRWSNTFDLDPNLVAAVMQVSSCGNPHMISDTDHYGVFQVDEFEFTAGTTMLNPNRNAQQALNRLQRCTLSAGDNLQHALACYDSDVSAINNVSQWSPETFAYATFTTGIYWEAEDEQSVTLNRWLNEGGELLCNRAQATLDTRQIVRQ